MSSYPVKSTRANIVTYPVRATGAAGSDLTISAGGVNIKSIARTGTGTYRITFQNFPVKFQNLSYSFGCDTLSDLKGYTLTHKLYDETTNSIDIAIWNSSFAAADLAAAQYLTMVIQFAEAV